MSAGEVSPRGHWGTARGGTPGPLLGSDGVGCPVGQVPGEGAFYALTQADGGAPPLGGQQRDVHQLARRAVRLAAVVLERPLVPDDIGNDVRKFPDCHVLSGSDV